MGQATRLNIPNVEHETRRTKNHDLVLKRTETPITRPISNGEHGERSHRNGNEGRTKDKKKQAGETGGQDDAGPAQY